MNSMIQEIGPLLYEKFFFNNQAYAVQEIIEGDPKFYTKHHRIDANKINYYINEKKSLLAYQQKFDKLKWVCLDFDILKSVIQKIDGYDFLTDNIYRPMLIEEVSIACEFLDDLNIMHTTEFSGNRGIHIWLFFKEEITKKLGFTIIDKLMDLIPFKYINLSDAPIGVDLFPKVPESKNNIVGKGVKIPLSFHLKSNRYSYILTKYKTLNSITSLSEEFLKEQITLLQDIRENSVEKVVNTLNIEEISAYEQFQKRIGSFTKKVTKNEIIEMLSKSTLFKYLFKNISNLSENERRILVGTFARIEYKGDSKYGLKLLKEIISECENYNESITNTKIDLLKNLYPPSIEYIENILGLKCKYCAENNVKNVIDLLDGVTFREIDELETIVDWAILSEINYLNSNDEVPLGFIEDELKNLSINHICTELNGILNNGKFNQPVYYKFVRQEEDKERVLYSLSGSDRVITTTLMKYIHDVIGVDNISPISYSYRINSSSKSQVFINWNLLWLEFMKVVQGCIDHPAYNEYYVIRLDIKQFYDSINQPLLKEILNARSKSEIKFNFLELSLMSLSDEKKGKYKNAVNYLIETCKVFGDKGVPQGPAFARYLAEIYLSSLDNYLISKLDNRYDFVCRYVDDYYIFIKDIDKGKIIKNSLKAELEKIYLDTNSKFNFGILKDIKYDIICENQIEKYFIDGIDNGTPESIKGRAIILLHKMFTEFNNSDDIKDFPFFLTHLFDEDYLKKISPDLIEKVSLSKIGRGSLFKHFYKNIACKYSELEFYKSVEGLSRSNLITSLFLNECSHSKNVEELVDHYLNIKLFDYEKKELLRFILLVGINFNVNVLGNDDFTMLLNLIGTISEITWNTRLLEKVLTAIQDLENKNQAIAILERILSVSKTMPLNKKFVEVTYSIIKENFESCYFRADKQTLFNLVAYCTLYVGSKERISVLWFPLLKVSGEYRINHNEWLKFSGLISLNSISINTIINFLVASFKGISIIDGEETKNIEHEFSCYLFLYLSSIEDRREEITKELYELVKKVAIDNKIEFLTWCCEDAKYLLLPELSTMNIEINDRVVLKKKGQILVRGRREIFEESDVDVIKENWNENISKYYKICYYSALNSY